MADHIDDLIADVSPDGVVEKSVDLIGVPGIDMPSQVKPATIAGFDLADADEGGVPPSQVDSAAGIFTTEPNHDYAPVFDESYESSLFDESPDSSASSSLFDEEPLFPDLDLFNVGSDSGFSPQVVNNIDSVLDINSDSGNKDAKKTEEWNPSPEVLEANVFKILEILIKRYGKDFDKMIVGSFLDDISISLLKKGQEGIDEFVTQLVKFSYKYNLNTGNEFARAYLAMKVPKFVETQELQEALAAKEKLTIADDKLSDAKTAYNRVHKNVKTAKEKAEREFSEYKAAYDEWSKNKNSSQLRAKMLRESDEYQAALATAKSKLVELNSAKNVLSQKKQERHQAQLKYNGELKDFLFVFKMYFDK